MHKFALHNSFHLFFALHVPDSVSVLTVFSSLDGTNTISSIVRGGLRLLCWGTERGRGNRNGICQGRRRRSCVAIRRHSLNHFRVSTVLVSIVNGT